MPGALIHIAAGLLSAFIVFRLYKKLEFSLAIFLGNLLPDVIKISFLAMYHKNLDLTGLIQSNYHHFTHGLANGLWFTLVFFIFWIVLGWLLYHYHFVKKKKFYEWEELIIFLLIGYIIHIALDSLEVFIYAFLPSIPIWL
ncbi:MAG: hypothetical protein Q8R00_01185 [Candidatus Nanoarchaeia archaeon]|nr:hypothetical protein [Candidatus Nanoarchaeia archaeon]